MKKTPGPRRSCLFKRSGLIRCFHLYLVFALCPQSLTKSLASCARSSEVFKSLKEGDHLRRVWSESTINFKRSIFSHPKRTHIFSSGQNESTSSPYSLVKVAVENHQLKSGISGRKICFFAGCFSCVSHRIISEGIVFYTNFCSTLKAREPCPMHDFLSLTPFLQILPDPKPPRQKWVVGGQNWGFRHHSFAGQAGSSEEQLPSRLWGYVSGRVVPNQISRGEKHTQLCSSVVYAHDYDVFAVEVTMFHKKVTFP